MVKRSFIVGIDEVGRGPLAGPITVGAVVMRAAAFPHSKRIFPDIRDSKKLTGKEREKWYISLTANNALFYATASIGQKTIDKKGISVAARMAVSLVLTGLEKKYPFMRFKMIYLDGSLHAPSVFRQKTVIKGDEKIPLVSAASIIAKVTRDRLMVAYSKKWPQYGFDRHKGYGTRSHYAAIRRHGMIPLHRKSFMRS